MIKIQGASPFDKGRIIKFPDGDQILVRDPYLISESFVTHTVLEGQTIQNIAFAYYGDSGLWGLIADANGIMNPFEDLHSGLQLKIPNYGR